MTGKNCTPRVTASARKDEQHTGSVLDSDTRWDIGKYALVGSKNEKRKTAGTMTYHNKSR